MSVLDREALEQSPLADLHAIASELSIDSYRLLRREQLVEAILARQDGADVGADPAVQTAEEVEPAAPPKARRRRARQQRTPRAEPEPAPEPAESETDQPATDAVADRARFESLAAEFPTEPLGLSSDDPTVAAIESLTPIGKGSRVSIVGPARAGKTEALRRLAGALEGHDDLQLLPLLVGVRPEEIGEWEAGSLQPAQALSFATPTSALDRAVYTVIDEVRAIALRGGDAVILLDTLDALHEHAARRAFATARKIRDGGSVTLIATSSEPLGGETTVVTLDPVLAGAGRFPALDLRSSGTIRPELLVGEEVAARITRERADRLASQ
ncbi:MAG: Rho termination factor N-terminal domain-containing protein [Solirubrobacteraceae bacterium]